MLSISWFRLRSDATWRAVSERVLSRLCRQPFVGVRLWKLFQVVCFNRYLEDGFPDHDETLRTTATLQDLYGNELSFKSSDKTDMVSPVFIGFFPFRGCRLNVLTILFESLFQAKKIGEIRSEIGVRVAKLLLTK